jgi:hypothetical protein
MSTHGTGGESGGSDGDTLSRKESRLRGTFKPFPSLDFWKSEVMSREEIVRATSSCARIVYIAIVHKNVKSSLAEGKMHFVDVDQHVLRSLPVTPGLGSSLFFGRLGRVQVVTSFF